MTAALARPLLDRRLDGPPPGKSVARSARVAARLRESRRAHNLERSGTIGRLRCECALPGCRETFPAAGAAYRGTAERFIVVPAHLGAIVAPADIPKGTVARAADRFFVVELNGSFGRFPARVDARKPRGAADRGRLRRASWSSSTSRPWLKT